MDRCLTCGYVGAWHAKSCHTLHLVRPEIRSAFLIGQCRDDIKSGILWKSVLSKKSWRPPEIERHIFASRAGSCWQLIGLCCYQVVLNPSGSMAKGAEERAMADQEVQASVSMAKRQTDGR